MLSYILGQCPSYKCGETHWSVVAYGTIGTASTVTFVALMVISMKQKASLLPYAVSAGLVSATSIPAAFLINHYYTTKTINDASSAIEEGAEDLEDAAEAVEDGTGQLQATVLVLERTIAAKNSEILQITQKLADVETKLGQTEDDFTRTFEQSRVDMQQVITLLDDTDQLRREVEGLGKITTATQKLEALVRVVNLAMSKLKEQIELAKASAQVDEVWDENRAQLDASTQKAEMAARLMQQVEAKMEELVALAKYVKAGKLLEKQDAAKFNELVEMEVDDGSSE